MLPHDKKELLEVFRKTMKKDPHAFDITFQALERLRCLFVLWGLESPENVHFLDSNDKRHTLLAYKYLRVLWLDRLPLEDDKSFGILVAGGIPKTATPEKVLETFSWDNERLSLLCKNTPAPTRISQDDVKRIVMSIASFPREVRQ